MKATSPALHGQNKSTSQKQLVSRCIQMTVQTFPLFVRVLSTVDFSQPQDTSVWIANVIPCSGALSST